MALQNAGHHQPANSPVPPGPTEPLDGKPTPDALKWPYATEKKSLFNSPRPYSWEWVFMTLSDWLSKLSFGLISRQPNKQQRATLEALQSFAWDIDIRSPKSAEELEEYHPDTFDSAQASLDVIFGSTVPSDPPKLLGKAKKVQPAPAPVLKVTATASSKEKPQASQPQGLTFIPPEEPRLIITQQAAEAAKIQQAPPVEQAFQSTTLAVEAPLSAEALQEAGVNLKKPPTAPKPVSADLTEYDTDIGFSEEGLNGLKMLAQRSNATKRSLNNLVDQYFSTSSQSVADGDAT